MQPRFSLFSCAALAFTPLLGAADFPSPHNSQVETIPFTTPAQALAGIHLPEGFKATLFASEPTIRQPINIATDACGRLWIAECFTYAEANVIFDTKLRDRITILEDTDGDGRADKNTVFWDQAVELTSVAPGFGGAFVLCPPKLLFIPDRNGDDVPDSEPQVLLDGFDATAVRHNIANGLHFGPDGWLYGRHGILATSKVGVPGTPAEKRANVNACIWRYHPVTHKFEVVAEGTTNSWGDDWDENGQHFFINTVIGHLWHVIPGAYYKRMYGEHPNPYLYELIDQTADHFHWDTREVWSDIRKLGVTSTTDQFGGGHAHSGFMIYLGDNWPAQYRNTAFTVNYHGRRLNNDRLERAGATYVAKHNPDLGRFDDPWFRGVELTYGPDGGVYVADWSDIGECHDNDGVHRSSGRIFKITYGDPKPWKMDLSKSTNDELVEHQFDKNEWFVRQSRLLLQERATAGGDMKNVHNSLRRRLSRGESFPKQPPPPLARVPSVKGAPPNPAMELRALWGLYVTGGLEESQLGNLLLLNKNEFFKAWVVQLLVDQDPPFSDVDSPSIRLGSSLTSAASLEKSGLVLTAIASAMRRIPDNFVLPFNASGTDNLRLAIAKGLISHAEFANDPVFPLMIWYGIEPAIPKFPKQAVALALESKLPKIRTFITRRLFDNLTKDRVGADEIVKLLAASSSPAFQTDILTGIDDALKGVQKVDPLPAWKAAALALSKSNDKRVLELFTRLNALFGDGLALDSLRAVVADPKNDLAQRRRAFATLLQARAPNLISLIVGTFNEVDIVPDAIRGLATLGDPSTPDLLIAKYNDLRSGTAKAEAINTLASRPAFAIRLLEAIRNGQIKRGDINATQLRQLRGFNDKDLGEKIVALWPQLDESPNGKKQLYDRYKNLFTPERLQKADATAGRALFQTACASCHTLFGEGAKIGPDLTGSDRRNLDYLLENILNPSAIVPETYRASTINLKDDRSISGIILNQTEQAVTIQTTTEKLTLQKSDIQSTVTSQLSMMPDGLLTALNDDQVANLIAYLSSQR